MEGKRPIASRSYNHNFLVFDGQAPGPDIAITFPFPIQSPAPPDAALASLSGNQILYRKTLQGEERVMTEITGFSKSASDYNVLVANTRTGAGVRVTGDRPLARLMLWSIRAVLSAEPFVEFSVQPGQTYNWTLTYQYQ